ncbi:MAG TPA: hypothetical protein DCW72_03320 [Elusimicrobia bacterium]|nr:MAG: hypothetical protein A2X29_01010 [Elusimicrobia bacterium GWA2_64_40]OGR66787.1 MAG: hypothetical protein A2X30_11920 [Elusimicrobia bacterium GWB2_63_16]HAN04000.1 hypothetical protein [Elusimicrobiota bacterium]HAU89283.1 hypothetical protein [Elusimicrobiota bacterium]
MKAKFSLLFSLLFSPALPAGAESLLFLEAQGVAGYSSMDRAVVWHSMSASEPMQKSSVGFDLLKKFSGDTGDTGTLAVQGRLARDPDAPNRLEPQLYNAYYRARTPAAYIWAGHSRAAAGLESYFDTHGALLQALPMYGYGFDRDWGFGASRDFDWGDAALSLTSGTGMRARAAGNYLLSGRLARGVLNRDNYAAGFYFSSGKIPEMAGYKVLDGEERTYTAAGADGALLWNRWELRGDLRAGEKAGMRYVAGLGRLGLNLLEENRLKLEAQAVYSGMERMEGWALASGFSLAVTPALTWRALFEYEDAMHERRLVTQLYYYLPI